MIKLYTPEETLEYIIMWLYNESEFTEDMISDNVGFVYVITNLMNNKQYIGRKLFTKSKTYQKNKKKKKTRVSSDWMIYTGSNEQLNIDINNGDQIKKEIIHLCTSKGWMTYIETKEILVRDCLLSENYYNYWVSCKIRRSHLK
jgi:hypothetical protein